jgi:hypothetical protein
MPAVCGRPRCSAGGSAKVISAPCPAATLTAEAICGSLVRSGSPRRAHRTSSCWSRTRWAPRRSATFVESIARCGRVTLAPPRVEAPAPAAAAPHDLTPRELQVLRLVAGGARTPRSRTCCTSAARSRGARLEHPRQAGVACRAAAAAIAARLDLLDEAAGRAPPPSAGRGGSHSGSAAVVTWGAPPFAPFRGPWVTRVTSVGRGTAPRGCSCPLTPFRMLWARSSTKRVNSCCA